ncbi:MAG: hypothetical protein HOE83_04185 [Alphaproteobacteria bacterium]|nr:hypothetical protein [Alphaproteobacteria bacterium]
MKIVVSAIISFSLLFANYPSYSTEKTGFSLASACSVKGDVFLTTLCRQYIQGVIDSVMVNNGVLGSTRICLWKMPLNDEKRVSIIGAWLNYQMNLAHGKQDFDRGNGNAAALVVEGIAESFPCD